MRCLSRLRLIRPVSAALLTGLSFALYPLLLHTINYPSPYAHSLLYSFVSPQIGMLTISVVFHGVRFHRSQICPLGSPTPASVVPSHEDLLLFSHVLGSGIRQLARSCCCNHNARILVFSCTRERSNTIYGVLFPFTIYTPPHIKFIFYPSTYFVHQ